jgi:hypothetical protein
MSEPIKGRAHTPEQKRAIVERLYTLWLTCPALRLGQLLECAHAGTLLYYIEDEDLLALLEDATKEQVG